MGVSQSAKVKIALRESQINLLNTKLSEEQEKIIALENYSRRENLRFMNIPEQEHENCTDTVYDIVENGLNINTRIYTFMLSTESVSHVRLRTPITIPGPSLRVFSAGKIGTVFLKRKED